MESSNSKDIGSDFIEVKQLLQNQDELCYTMEALSLQVQNLVSYVPFYIKYVHTYIHTHTYVCIHTHALTHTHSHTHACTQTHTPTQTDRQNHTQTHPHTQ